MDIENMHPFCLPFSLCHDATSSSCILGAGDDDDEMMGSKSNTHTTKDSSEKPSNNNNYNEEQQIRLKHDDNSPSPMEDLLHGLEVTSPRSPALHGSFIHETTSADDDAYHSLHLDIDMSSSAGLNDDEFGLREMDCHEDDDSYHHHHSCPHKQLSEDDHWHSSISATHDCPLFSPSGGASASMRHKARHDNHHHHHLQHQVFQHVVDPIDIKSSPTLAQLNLNSADDPTDGLWASGGGPAGSASSSSSSFLAATSSTSTLISSTTHLHRQHQASLSSLLASASASSAAPSMTTTSDLSASTPNHCNGNGPNSGAHWCSSHMTNHSNNNNNNNNNVSSHQQVGQAPGNLIKHNQLLQHQQAVACSCKSHQNHQTPMGNAGGMLRPSYNQQRSSSPAPLVTSSSSPLSSQSVQLNGGFMGPCGHHTDNKLKENIEYLTVLLCNGSNKLDTSNHHRHHQQQQQQQQHPISSTMVKSYSTLAQSLSTGPKLLERYNQQQQHSHHYQALPCAQHAASLPIGCNAEVLPQCVMQINHNHNHQQVLPNGGGGSGGQVGVQQGQWFRSATMGVEASVSAADSTAEQTANGLAPRPTGDMKVLSSLLSVNKPPYNQPAGYMIGGTPVAGPVWQQSSGASPQQMANVQVAGDFQQQQDTAAPNGSIPVNGRPITLAPRQQQTASINKSKPKFAQPASPSTSSTTSSIGNSLELGSSGSSSSSSSSSSTSSSSSGSSIASSATGAKKPRQSSGSSSSSSSSSAASKKQDTPPQAAAAAAAGGRLNSLSTDCSLSSHDEGFSSQMDQDDCGNSVRGDANEDSDDESDIDSDDESFYGDYTNNDLIGASISDNPDCKWTLNMGRTRRNGQRRFFWQYNVQSKGPKGTRICAADSAEDPFVLPEASDPVFSNECQIEGVKHSGKARRGDGNDLTPNPRKLLMIGLELKKLSKIINELAPVTDMPVNARNKTRKEKNKLASRACRLKKKAQHEANKIKLFGLQREHQQIVMAIYDARKTINKSLATDDDLGGAAEIRKRADTELSTCVRGLLEQCSITVAGQTSDYVNSVLEKVVSGCIDGGLQTN